MLGGGEDRGRARIFFRSTWPSPSPSMPWAMMSARQHLHLADLAGPGAGGRIRIEIAMADHFDRRQKLRAEQFGPAAVMRQRCERVHGVEIGPVPRRNRSPAPKRRL